MNFFEIIQSLVLLAVFLQSISYSVTLELCQKKSQWGFALELSHYTSFSTKDYPECLYYCLKDRIRCKSLTYDLMSKTCKLNFKTRLSNPSQYVKKSNNIYKEMLNVSVVEVNHQSTLPTTSQTSASTTTTSQASALNPTTSQASTTSSTATPTTKINDFCVGKSEGYYDHPSDCTKYIACLDLYPGLTMTGACTNKPPEATSVCGGC